MLCLFTPPLTAWCSDPILNLNVILIYPPLTAWCSDPIINLHIYFLIYLSLYSLVFRQCGDGDRATWQHDCKGVPRPGSGTAAQD